MQELAGAFAIVAGLGAVPALLTAYQVARQDRRSTDHYVHLSLVELIRRNSHRFIRRRENYLYNQEIAYPQLVHWLLSWLPPELVTLGGRSLTPLTMFLSTLLTGTLAWQLLPSGPARLVLLTVCCALHVLTPFTYWPGNAKNRGLSPRGFGLLCGQAFVVSIVMHRQSEGVAWLALATLAAVFVILSSQFVLQWLVLSTPVLLLLERDWHLLWPVATALAVLLLIAPRWTSGYLRGQLRHKRFYSSHLARHSLLKSRPSVWRDFVHDIWLRFPELLRAEKRAGALEYIVRNPMIVAVSGFPATAMVLGFAAFGAAAPAPPGVASVVVTSGALTLLTSFRSTRFLGEPERYLELSIGPAALWAVLSFARQPWLLAGLISFCGVIIAANTVYFYGSVQRRGARARWSELVQRIDLELARFERDQQTETRLLSNDRQIMKALLTVERRVFLGTRTSEQIGPWRWQDVHETVRWIHGDVLGAIVREFDINVLIVDTDRLRDVERVLGNAGIEYRDVARAGHLRLLRVAVRRHAPSERFAFSKNEATKTPRHEKIY